VSYAIKEVHTYLNKMENNHILKASQKLDTIVSWRADQITTTDAARRLSELGASDAEVNSYVLRTHKSHEPSGIPYSSGRIRWTTDQSHLPFSSSSPKINYGRWEILIDQKGESALAKESAISFSEEATESPKLERDLAEVEVDSPSQIYASEFSESSPAYSFG